MIGGIPMLQLNDIEQEWFNQIQEARSSGLSDWEWCRQNKIPSSTFYYHIRKLRDKAADIPACSNTVTTELHEVVKVEIQDEEAIPVVSSFKKTQAASHITSIPDSCSSSTNEPDYAARICLGDVTIEFGNNACEQIILSVISALRCSC